MLNSGYAVCNACGEIPGIVDEVYQIPLLSWFSLLLGWQIFVEKDDIFELAGRAETIVGYLARCCVTEFFEDFLAGTSTFCIGQLQNIISI